MPPSLLSNLVRRLRGLPPEEPRIVPCVIYVPQITYTVVGGSHEYTIMLDADDEAEQVAQWLRCQPNKFEAKESTP